MNNKVKLLLLLAVVATSCDNGDYIQDIMLGARSSEMILSTPDAGSNVFEMVSNVDYTAYVKEGAEWLTITEVTPTKIAFDYMANNGFKRTAKIIYSFGNRIDSTLVRQSGIYTGFVTIDKEMVDVPSEGGSYTLLVETNLLARDIDLQVSDENKIVNVVYRRNTISFDVTPSSKPDTRIYTLSLTYTDGWGAPVTTTCTMTQAPM